MASITAANAIYILSLPGLFPAPVQIQGFASDDAFATESVKPVETQMGVDGNLSGGFVPTEKVQTVTLQADSPSSFFFEGWEFAQETSFEVLTANGSLALPSIGRIYTLTLGFLTAYEPTPGVRKVLQPRRFGITWNKITPAPAING